MRRCASGRASRFCAGGALARSPDAPLALVLLQLAAALRAQDELAAQMPLRLKALERVLAERHLPVASALRRAGRDRAKPSGGPPAAPRRDRRRPSAALGARRCAAFERRA